jgi:lipoprotein-anchoring transpeptidase ErfK/SrfK
VGAELTIESGFMKIQTVIRAAVVFAAMGAMLVGAGPVTGDTKPAVTASVAAVPAPNASTCPYVDLRFEVVVEERRLYLFDGGREVASHPVSVGKPGHETPRGEYEITLVTWNPDWIPPDSEWAEGREPKDPGEESNPMGRAKILWNAPYYTIHGTEAEHSLGEAQSHGSVRVSNPVVKELAELVMECGGAPRGEAWYEEVRASPTDMREVEIPDPIPLAVRG